MYAIANIVYGYPLTRSTPVAQFGDAEEKAVSKMQDDFSDALDEEPPLLTYYSGGSSVVPMALGIELDSFDEATDYVEMAALKQQPTPAQVAELASQVAALPPALQRALQKLGPPRVFILWSTS